MTPSTPPILGQLNSGVTQRHLIQLPGATLAGDEPRPIVTVCGAKTGPVLFVNAGVHGGEYPAIEAVIRLGRTLDPKAIAGTVILMPVLNLPAFRKRTMFVCPVDNVNPNRVFQGDPNGEAALLKSIFATVRDRRYRSSLLLKFFFFLLFGLVSNIA
jgi:predicted deacylase